MPSLSFILQSLFLILAVIFSFIWTQNPTLSSYNLQLTGLLVLLYFTSKLFASRRHRLIDIESTIILITITLLLIFSTGGITSPLFFLLIFLLFALSLLFSPLQIAITSLSLSLVFALNLSSLDTTSLLNLIFLLLTTPLALLFGQKYLQVQKAQGKIKILETTLAHEQTNTLLFLSTSAKPDLFDALTNISHAISSNRLPHHLQKRLQETYSKLIKLYQSTNELKQEVANNASRDLD